MKKPRVCQLRLDNHRFKDRRGKFIERFKGRDAVATEWQKDQLMTLGYKRESLSLLRFHVANQLLHKLKDAHRSGGPSGSTPKVDEGTPAQEQKTGD
jgi:hypothetical protein